MLAFIHIEKTAGTTVSFILRSSFGIHHCDVQPVTFKKNVFTPFLPDDLRWVCRVNPGLQSIAGHSVTPYTGLEDVGIDIRYFSILRDPIRQVASFFQFVCQSDGKQYAFEELIAQDWLRNMQTKRLAGIANADTARKIILEKNIFIGLQDKFDESLLLLKGLVEPRINVAYVSQRVAPDQTIARNVLNSSYYRKLILDAVNADLELYEWVTKELYPCYKHRYYELLGVDVSQASVDQNRLIFRMNWMINWLYRNAVYKPLRNLRSYSTIAKS